MPVMKRTCQQCGKVFQRDLAPSQIKLGWGKYCGHKCHNLARRTRVKSICKQCGKEFFVLPSKIKNGWGKYCGNACRDFALTTKTKRVCQVCGKEFFVLPSQIKLGWGKYCGTKCQYLARRKGTLAHKGMKQCSVCQQTLPVARFTLRKKAKDGLHSECKVCQRQAELRRKYHLSVEELPLWNRALLLGKCMICGKPAQEEKTSIGTGYSLSLDHDHTTQQNRGVLCNHCNTALGFFQDNPTIFQKAIDYLTNPPGINGIAQQMENVTITEEALEDLVIEEAPTKEHKTKRTRTKKRVQRRTHVLYQH